MIGNIATILGININSTELVEVLNIIVGWKSKDRLVVFTPNPEFVVEAQSDPEFKELLNQADINIPDGIGLVWAGKLLGQPVKERVSGADVVERLLETGNKGCEVRSGSRSEGEKWVMGIAGARRGVQEEANILIKKLSEKYPNIKFVNLDSVIARSPDVHRGDEAIPNGRRLLRGQAPRNDRFQIVFACHGMKKQEKWIWENASYAKATERKINSNVFMGVGGSLDFLTGFSKRAPSFIRFVSLEWLWRGLHNLKHFKRIWKAVFVFGWLVIREKVNKLF